MKLLVDAKRRMGCWFNERWRAECALNPVLNRITGIRWLDLCNRFERLEAGGDADSRVCNWKWTSELTVCQVFPGTARRLCRRCFEEWPLADGSTHRPDPAGEARLSVILPVGGTTRHAALMATVGSFLRQTVTAYEIIVVEQSPEPLLASALPEGVRYTHVPDAHGVEGFNKSVLLNKAVRLARAPWVLLHDADIVVPAGYLGAIEGRAAKGWEAVRPIRLLFYLGEEGSSAFVSDGLLPARVERVTQNFPGGSTAVKRDTYWRIGGHNERFVGWGGEDTEFLSRLRTCRLFPGHFAPAIHLWHPPAPKKKSGDRNQELLDSQMAVPVEDRVRQLREETQMG